MAPKRSSDDDRIKKAIEAFLSLPDDVPKVHNVEQRLELHLVETNAYVPSYTRQVMDQNHGAPVTALVTRTHRLDKEVYIYAAQNPKDKRARTLRSGTLKGPGYFAFGVPLRELNLKLPENHRIVLPMTMIEVPELGAVYVVSFAELEMEVRKLGANTGGNPGGGTPNSAAG